MRNIGKILITLWVCAMLGLVTGMFFSSRIQFAGNGIKYDLGDDFYQVGEIFEFSDSQVAGAKDITADVLTAEAHTTGKDTVDI